MHSLLFNLIIYLFNYSQSSTAQQIKRRQQATLPIRLMQNHLLQVKQNKENRIRNRELVQEVTIVL